MQKTSVALARYFPSFFLNILITMFCLLAWIPEPVRAARRQCNRNAQRGIKWKEALGANPRHKGAEWSQFDWREEWAASPLLSFHISIGLVVTGGAQSLLQRRQTGKIGDRGRGS